MQKIIALFFAIFLFVTTAFSQTPRKVIIEHFTNTDCSICASKNPAFFATLRNYPQVIHIAYHPDQPHPTCRLSHENRPENIARTQFYSVYGATPRAVISGTVIPPKSPMVDTLDITSQLHQFSAISLVSKMKWISADSIDVVTIVITTDTMRYRKVYLLVNVTEDTIVYTGTNGEREHFDVFHKQLYSGRGLSFTPSTNIGDTVFIHTGFRVSQVDSVWQKSRINLISMVQDSATKFVYQADKQTSIDTVAATINTGIAQYDQLNRINIYPNPVSDQLFFEGAKPKSVSLFSLSGVLVSFDDHLLNGFSVRDVQNGAYIISVVDDLGNQQISRVIVIH